MNRNVNYRLVAIQIGDLLKYDVVEKEIIRAAKSIFTFNSEEFPNEAGISSVRAKCIYDWIMTLAKQKMTDEERTNKLVAFLDIIVPSKNKENVSEILYKAGATIQSHDNSEFLQRKFHHLITTHCKKLFLEGNYFHAVFEASKVYNYDVKEKSKSLKDGQPLMLEVWSSDKGVLKITSCVTETDKNVQDGVKFLSAGLMSAIRNPTAHEPALTWPIDKDECLEILGFISYLFRQLDKAVYYDGSKS